MLTLADVAEALTGKRPAAWAAHSIAAWHVDSRQCVPGSAFVALPGEQTDGHRHIGDALSRGAQVVLAERSRLPEPLAAALIDLGAVTTQAVLQLPAIVLAPSSLRAFQDIAAWWRRRFALQVIGVTGSVGKTITKETIAAVLGRRFRTYKSAGNLNSESGLPLALLAMDSRPERAVFEMGMYDLGEITRLAEIAQPHIGVVTNVGPSHLERLGSIERIAQAKAELPRALPADGWAVLNGDDPLVSPMRHVTAARVITYGLDPANDLWAGDVEGLGLKGTRFWVHHGSTRLHVTVPLLGRHSVHTALAAAAVGIAEGMDWEEIIGGLQDVSGQLRLAAVGAINDATLIDDTYNASPTSCIAALNLLSELEGRKIAVLADMLELGDYEREAHELVGRRAAEVADIVVAVGSRARTIGACAIDEGMDRSRVYFCADKTAAVALLRELLQAGDMVLVKGSRGMAMEDVVTQLSVHRHHGH
ncbi:MAG: UDP-N-acetylmuramoyl-tripeptide--D-alanyl-D-alanine ligase [Chloroflexi bacterium]|nr:UDP-N-acetylmuramoyl-tripeptide--D-alanyl-D-alanine ligase [Chloroflexota bacterium]